MSQHPLSFPLPQPDRPQLQVVRKHGRPLMYSEQEMVEALRAAKDSGHLSRNEYQAWVWRQKRAVPSANTIIRYFGSWNEALTQAGFVTRKAPR